MMATSHGKLPTRLLYVAIAVLVLGLVAVDAITPRGLLDGFPYVAVVVLSIWLPRAKDTWLVSAGCSGALLVGLVLSPPSGVLWRTLANRGLALFALWVAAALINTKRRSQEVFELAVEGLPHVVLMVDRQGVIRLANQQVQNVFGYEPDELLGQHVETLVPPEFRGSHPDLRESFHAAPAMRPMGAGRHLHAMKKNGTAFPVEIGLTPLRIDRKPHVLCTVIDITERKQTEQAIKAQAGELEALVSIISHDLKEPLRAVESFSRLVYEDASDRLEEKHRDFLRRVVAAADRMRTLLNDLVDLSRARRGGLNDEFTEVAPLVEEAVSQLADEIESTGAKIVVASDLPKLRVDPTWVTQAIYNLISNALKFTLPDAPPDVEVAAYTASDNGHAGIVVRDRGPGVSPEHRERIFEMFQRAHGRDVKGTGAGLAIVKAVAERHGGRVSVEPRSGGGSEFIVMFATGDDLIGGEL